MNKYGKLKYRLKGLCHQNFIWALCAVLNTDSCVIGYIVHWAFIKIEKFILPEFVKEPSPSKLVNGTKTGCKNMVNGTKVVLHNWLAEQKMSFKIG